ncbi:MAG: D-glycero-beta-D-manno-heptose-7-phosphate kinase [Bradyrhizobiaceae bacterium]|nr:D-glycero-beta-D-manno-heptose-7-phosphate kinase [Bradyrhizobiaceae bacterium]
MVHVTTDRLHTILARAAGATIAVLGDIMLDRYFWGAVHRISPEAPVPVVDVDNETFHLGGAANVAANILGLHANPVLFGVIGDDASGRTIKQLAQTAGLDASGLIVSPARPTTVKTRIIGNNQQLLRLDRETREDVDPDVINSVISGLNAIDKLHAIVLEDYDKGFLSDSLIVAVIALAKEKGIPVFVDPKRHALNAYRGVFLYKPNRKEASDILGRPLTTADAVVEAGRELQAILQCPNVLITLGPAGMMLFEERGVVSSVPTRARSVADVSGAGDTAIATLATCIAGGATVQEAATLANTAAGVVVGEPGIVSITKETLLEAVHDDALRSVERQ